MSSRRDRDRTNWSDPRVRRKWAILLSAPLLLGVLACAFGFGGEWVRQRGRREWAQSIGGRFESRGIASTEGIRVREGEAFDAAVPAGACLYQQVVRVQARDVSYVIAEHVRSSAYRGPRRRGSATVLLADCGGAPFPAFRVEVRATASAGEKGSAPLPLPSASAEAFAARFTIGPVDGTDMPPDAEVERVLTPRVRSLLLASSPYLSDVEFRGSVFRLESSPDRLSDPCEEMYALAKALVAAWGR